MKMWRIRNNADGSIPSEPLTAAEVADRMLEQTGTLFWLESDEGAGDFAADVPEVRDVLLGRPSTVASVWFERSGTSRHGWAWQVVEHACNHDPEGALPVIRALVAEAKDDEELAVIGAGPLETLLRCQGPQAISLVEVAAAEDRRFRFALAGVWPSERNPEVWTRWTTALGDQKRY